MNRLTIVDGSIIGLKIVQRQRIDDSRGFLDRVFCSEELALAGWHRPLAQVNHTLTKKLGTIRGMHFQHPPYAEMKLVTCTHGKIWDVAVDLRYGSSTYLKWHAQELSAENQTAMLIPEGFAHGFQALESDSEVLYIHSLAHAPGSEAGINPRDPCLSINWPLPVSDISSKDAQRDMIDQHFKGVTL
jgi:dTDP-4-dehydrorhamnose 3,5-epimerase